MGLERDYWTEEVFRQFDVYFERDVRPTLRKGDGHVRGLMLAGWLASRQVPLDIYNLADYLHNYDEIRDWVVGEGFLYKG